MAFSVEMPALGESVTEGTVTRWLKQEGDTVEVDEPLLEVSTDKVDTEIPSPAAGVLTKILAQEDETVEVGAALAEIGDASESGGSDSGGSAEAESAPEPEPEPEPAQEAEPEQEEAPASGPQPSSDASSGGSGKGTPVTMPALGESVTEGTVTRWLKQVGDAVEVDEPLLEVSTDKVDTEIPSPVAGTLLEISAGEDATVEVGGKLAVIGNAGAAPAAPEPEQAPEPPKQEAPKAEPKQEAPKQEAPKQEAPKQEAPKQEAPKQAPKRDEAPEPAQAETNGSAPYVTPLVRKLAGEHGVDLSSLKGTGVGGRIRKQDVLAAAEAKKAESAKPAEPAQPERRPAAASTASTPQAPSKPGAVDTSLRGTTQKMTRLRQTVSRRMVESLQTAAQLTQVVEVDVTRIAKLRSRAKAAFEAREGVKLTFLPFFAKATVEALKQHPKLNASIDEEAKEVTYHGAEHLGIAVDTERGLLTPAIHDAGELNLAGLAHKITDLADRTRANKVTPDELFGATFNLTNLGSQGALFDTPIIQLPQVGILGVGLVVKRPVVITDENGDDTIAVRSMVYLALTYDHRLVDGADAGRFLSTVKNRLEEGAFEADLGL
ncbi:2-oxoglutarate dehydrogenase, E2 component, dihydrolipoamide succinyltransferase [Actinokineospora sp. PR83]|uniref:2-oxoglutarate dehydrogenase, E2 component, dihydrolipoamide succinyltransferase n=1 Tax=Actinokineospora sp. PR83 TaxID=2884908 RepID=UPI001F1AB910|nr:2-oxoglutarate dehydrogenase, E2 component, dihydrolipoamide succinyltransferase [Actinokineospora sp. PR83]MCG8916857.1 2-oxoglutarate dehydrogenase, E2 component, dihydrolipoamide succinyltransferase [Actinokineospora sp. PR83]